MMKRGGIKLLGRAIEMYYFQVAMVICGLCLIIAALHSDSPRISKLNHPLEGQ